MRQRSRPVGRVAVVGVAADSSGGDRDEATLWPNGTVAADSASLTDVQAAVTAAVDGQIVTIPNGTVTWTGGITTTKQILIRALNYTPTEGGTMTRNVTITHNGGSAKLFQFTTGNTYHCAVAGIRFNEGTGTGNYLSVSGSGSKVLLVGDCTLQTTSRFGEIEDIAAVAHLALGGVYWNLRIDGSDYPNHPTDDLGNDVASVSIHVKGLERVWQTASTLGTLDTNGNVNVYVEDSTMHLSASGDIDDHGRVVVRHSLLNGVWWETHGFSSSWGGRSFEFYENTFSTTVQPRNLAGRYFWARAGHGVMFNNVVNEASTSDYSQPALFTSNVEGGTYNMTWDGSTWPKPRQAGCGHNGSAYVSDPIYFWGNTGDNAAMVSGTTDTPGVNIGRDLITTGAEKPGYTPYTYPHPLRFT
jgi:hypothetical protein